MNQWRRWAQAGLGLALAGGLWGAGPGGAGMGAASAAALAAPAGVSFTVNSANDAVADFTNDAAHTICRTNVANSTCTLRAAIMNANRLAGGATIILPAGSYSLGIPEVDPDGETNGNLNISTTVTLAGAGAASTVIDGGQLDNLFRVAPGAALTVTGVTLQNGRASVVITQRGGAIDNHGWLRLADSVARDNLALTGGGALNNSGTASLERVTLASNRVSSGQGGAIQNTGVMTITSSTLAGNQSILSGGAINNFPSGSLTVYNSTLSNNSTHEFGGALSNAGQASFLASTIAGNLADSDGTGVGQGGGLNNEVAADHLRLSNSLLVDNFVSTTLNACNGPLTSLDYNLFDRAAGCTVSGTTGHNVISVTAALLTNPLADNGGPTRTRGLLPGNPALGRIPAANCHDLFGSAPAPDQRGVARPAAANCDIGAVQLTLPQPPYARNLVFNGDAEASMGSANGIFVGQVPWGYSGQFTPVTYNATPDYTGVLSPTVPANHGFSFFTGGRVPASSGSQFMALPPVNSSIDQGRVGFVLSADLGGFQNQEDYAQASVKFEDQSFVSVGVQTVIPLVTASMRGNQTGFVHMTLPLTVVPAHARWASVEVDMIRVSAGTDNDGYADNISFVLLPEPAVWLPLARR